MKSYEDMAIPFEISEIIVNYMNVAVYVSDLATNEVLFANKAMRIMAGEETYAGKACWEALRNKTGRCEFCPIPYLLKNPGKGYHWEMCAEDTQLLLYDSIIPWANGRLAHMQCIVER